MMEKLFESIINLSVAVENLGYSKKDIYIDFPENLITEMQYYILKNYKVDRKTPEKGVSIAGIKIKPKEA